MDTCQLCRGMFRVFQLLLYVTFFWMVTSVLLERLPEVLRGLYLYARVRTTEIQDPTGDSSKDF